MHKRLFCTPQELAAMLHVTEQTIYNWIGKHEIDAKKFGRAWRIPIAEIVRLVGYNPFETTQPSTKNEG
jgi:excisionase family DNA binding protein